VISLLNLLLRFNVACDLYGILLAFLIDSNRWHSSGMQVHFSAYSCHI